MRNGAGEIDIGSTLPEMRLRSHALGVLWATACVVVASSSHLPDPADAAVIDCGRIQRQKVGPYTFARLLIRRLDAGVRKGRRYIRYQLNYTVRRPYRLHAAFTWLRVDRQDYFTRRRIITGDDSRNKVQRRNHKPWYAHTSVRVVPGSEIHFRGHVTFRPFRLPPNLIVRGDNYYGGCRAR